MYGFVFDIFTRFAIRSNARHVESISIEITFLIVKKVVSY